MTCEFYKIVPIMADSILGIKSGGHEIKACDPIWKHGKLVLSTKQIREQNGKSICENSKGLQRNPSGRIPEMARPSGVDGSSYRRRCNGRTYLRRGPEGISQAGITIS